MTVDIFLTLTLLAYAITTLLLFAFGANLARFSLVVWRSASIPVTNTAKPPPPNPWPTVTVQLPIYNELYVSRRVIEAVCHLDYPSDRLEIQVLDDSDDPTSALVDHVVTRARRTGLDIVHLRRSERTGYKAGALADGLRVARGEFVAIFDADFVPPPDFLERTVPHFDDENVGFVQTRWGHLNRDHSWLTRLQSLAIDGHFLVEQAARGVGGYWFNFNGTCGIWRVSAIHDAGGWTADTLTEDLDLSYRAHLRGWRGKYLSDVVVPGELPAQMSGFRRQQHRWARGSIECAMKLLGPVWRSDARAAVKIQATAHLCAYGVHLLLLALTLLYPLVVVASAGHPELRSLFGLAYPLALGSLAPVIFFSTGQLKLGRSLVKELPRIAILMTLGSGLMVNTLRAVSQIRTKPEPEFERTAKFGLTSTAGSGDWATKRYQARFDGIVYAELALGIYSLGSAWLAYQHRNWGVLFYSVVFASGLLAVVTMTLAQAISVRSSRWDRKLRIGLEGATAGTNPATVTEPIGDHT